MAMPMRAPPPDHRRRRVLTAGAGMVAYVVMRPVAAAPAELAAAVDAFAGGKFVAPGRVTLDVAVLVDNGNSVPVTINVDSPMTAADYVTTIALFNERNPDRDVAVFTLTPRCGRARVSTNIRLATSQKLVAVAQMSDGTFWSRTVDVVVVLAACIEGEP